jgi:protein TonB
MRGQVFAMSVPAPRQRGWAGLPCSVAAHAAIVMGLLCVPLLSEGDLPEPMKNMHEIFFVQPAVMPPPPPPAARLGATNSDRRPRPQPPQQSGQLVEPIEIPEEIPEDDPFDGIGVGLGSPDGVVGGSFDGVVGGTIVGGLTEVVKQTEIPPMPVGGKIKPPTKVVDAAPIYPDLARKIGVQGDVVMECVISREGRVSEIRIVSGHRLLREAAQQAATKWLYTPTLLNGVPVPVLLRATIQFRL